MARWAIGDIQGCYDEFQELLVRIAFNPAHDELWLAGDLVNRGPKSLETLRYIYSIQDSCRVVLGNHDLHLLAVANGTRRANNKDTFSDVLDAPDKEELISWLQAQPLIVSDHENRVVMMHAGIPPHWTILQAEQLANEVHSVLVSADAETFFRSMYSDDAVPWAPALRGPQRWRAITDYLTRMRFCTGEGLLDLKDKSSMKSERSGFNPWFHYAQTRFSGWTVLFGHWAALEGRTGLNNIHALDTGCVWGATLTAFNIDTSEAIQCDCNNLRK